MGKKLNAVGLTATAVALVVSPSQAEASKVIDLQQGIQELNIWDILQDYSGEEVFVKLNDQNAISTENGIITLDFQDLGITNLKFSKDVQGHEKLGYLAVNIQENLEILNLDKMNSQGRLLTPQSMELRVASITPQELAEISVVNVTPGNNSNLEGIEVVTVQAQGDNLSRLEIDITRFDGETGSKVNGIGGTNGQWQQLTVYANELDPYGSSDIKGALNEVGIFVEYDSLTTTWTLTFNTNMSEQEAGVITDLVGESKLFPNDVYKFHFIVVDNDGNASSNWGDVDIPTRTYNINNTIQEEPEVPIELFGSVIITYEDTEGNVLDSETIQQKVGTEETYNPKQFEGYTTDDESITIEILEEDEVREIKFIYELEVAVEYGIVNIEYKDEDGNILGTEAVQQEVGTTKTYTHKEFEGYELLGESQEITIVSEGQSFSIGFLYKAIEETENPEDPENPENPMTTLSIANLFGDWTNDLEIELDENGQVDVLLEDLNLPEGFSIKDSIKNANNTWYVYTSDVDGKEYLKITITDVDEPLNIMVYEEQTIPSEGKSITIEYYSFVDGVETKEIEFPEWYSEETLSTDRVMFHETLFVPTNLPPYINILLTGEGKYQYFIDTEALLQLDTIKIVKDGKIELPQAYNVNFTFIDNITGETLKKFSTNSITTDDDNYYLTVSEIGQFDFLHGFYLPPDKNPNVQFDGNVFSFPKTKWLKGENGVDITLYIQMAEEQETAHLRFYDENNKLVHSEDIKYYNHSDHRYDATEILKTYDLDDNFGVRLIENEFIISLGILEDGGTVNIYLIKKENVENPLKQYGKVTIYYETEDGKLLDKEEVEVEVGESYMAYAEDFRGYTLSKDSKSRELVEILREGQNRIIVFTYVDDKDKKAEDTGIVYIYYEDEKGNTIKRMEKEEIDLDEEEVFIAPDIKGYELISKDRVKVTLTEKYPEDEIVFVYKKVEENTEKKKEDIVTPVTDGDKIWAQVEQLTSLLIDNPITYEDFVWNAEITNQMNEVVGYNVKVTPESLGWKSTTTNPGQGTGWENVGSPVSSAKWYENDMNSMVSKGYYEPLVTADGNVFDESQESMYMSEAITVLCRVLVGEGFIQDEAMTDDAYGYLSVMVQNGLTTGLDDSQIFSTITRGEFFDFVTEVMTNLKPYEVKTQDATRFSDYVREGGKSKQILSIIKGTGNNNLDADRDITVAEVISLSNRILSKY